MEVIHYIVHEVPNENQRMVGQHETLLTHYFYAASENLTLRRRTELYWDCHISEGADNHAQAFMTGKTPVPDRLKLELKVVHVKTYEDPEFGNLIGRIRAHKELSDKLTDDLFNLVNCDQDEALPLEDFGE